MRYPQGFIERVTRLRPESAEQRRLLEGGYDLIGLWLHDSRGTFSGAEIVAAFGGDTAALLARARRAAEVEALYHDFCRLAQEEAQPAPA